MEATDEINEQECLRGRPLASLRQCSVLTSNMLVTKCKLPDAQIKALKSCDFKKIPFVLKKMLRFPDPSKTPFSLKVYFKATVLEIPTKPLLFTNTYVVQGVLQEGELPPLDDWKSTKL